MGWQQRAGSLASGSSSQGRTCLTPLCSHLVAWDAQMNPVPVGADAKGGFAPVVFAKRLWANLRVSHRQSVCGCSGLVLTAASRRRSHVPCYVSSVRRTAGEPVGRSGANHR